MRLSSILAATCLITSAALGQNPPLRVGAARADITPIRGEHRVIGMNGQPVVVDKINDPLSAKVVIFEHGEDRVALVSLDLIGYRDGSWDTIREGITRDTGITQFVCAVTHNHGSGFPTPDYDAHIIDRTLAAAREASANLTPAEVGFEHMQINEGYNRRILRDDGTVEMRWGNRDRIFSYPNDNELGVLSFRRVDNGDTIVTLVNYSVHPVISMDFNEVTISADYPGPMSSKVEAELGGLCVFLLGAAGDINPYDADNWRYADDAETFALMDQVATRLAEGIIKTSSRIEDYHANAELDFDRYEMPMALRTDGPHAEKTLEVELATFVIANRFAMATIPGELFVELGLDLKKLSPAESTWVVANAYSSAGYLPTLRAVGEGGYGADSSTRLEVGAGERMVTQALVSIRYQLEQVRPLQ